MKTSFHPLQEDAVRALSMATGVDFSTTEFSDEKTWFCCTVRDDRGAVDGEDEVARIVIRLEDELVALLEEQPERSGADELEERESPALVGEPPGNEEEAEGAELDDDVRRVHAP